MAQGSRIHEGGTSDWFSDTDPRALRVFLEAQRRMSHGEKFATMCRLTDFYGWDPEAHR